MADKTCKCCGKFDEYSYIVWKNEINCSKCFEWFNDYFADKDSKTESK